MNTGRAQVPDEGSDEQPPGEETTFDIIRRGFEISPGFKRAAILFAMVGVFEAAGRVAVPVLFQLIIDRGLLSPGGVDTGTLTRLLAVAVAVIIVVTLAALVAELAVLRVAERALSRLRVLVLRRAIDLSLAEHADERRGDLVSRVTGDVDTVARFLDWGAYSWIVDSSVAIGAVVVMFVYSWQLALVVTVAFGAMLPILRSIQRRQQLGYRVLRDQTGRLLGEVSETIGGAEVVRALGHGDASLHTLDAAIDAQYRAQVDVNRFTAVLFTVADVFGTIALSAVIVVTSLWGPDWGLDIGTVVAFLFLVQLVISPISELTEVIDQSSLALAGWRRSMQLLDRPHALPEPVAELAEEMPAGALAIDVDAMSFSYDDNLVLDEVDLHIAAGTSVAVVGPTGSGKTTFVRLLCRLADPDRGAVRLGGADLRNVVSAQRQERVRMVPQDGFLFATTVRDNIRRGRDGATEADINDAIDRLGLRDWIEQLPDGLATELGPGGDGLSVGERQLVALIRAQLADPGLLVLDEATSSLDPVTEKAMSDALDRISRDRTTISVAHRLSTAERADLIVVFDRGRIAETGSHLDLVALGGRYADLHQAWQRGTTSLDR